MAGREKLRGLGGWLSRRSRTTRLALLLVLAAILGMGSAGVYAVARRDSRRSAPDAVRLDPGPSTVRGVLRASAYAGRGGQEGALGPLRQVSVFVNGPDYASMEDNDLRGFLDGRFIYGWNQPGQIHTRLGRRDSSARFGEYELFRTLQRWGDIELAPGAHVLDASLAIGIEKGLRRELRVLLYPVRKDWDPGGGGALHDNTSPPVKGEVWWGDVAYQQESWGLPGVGFASDSHPQADTAAMPLAEVLYTPGDEELLFASEALARYVEMRVAEGKPLLFLLKLSDYLEDEPGTLIHLYSGSHGDRMNPIRRPKLRIEWESHAEITQLEQEVFLEFGRSLTLPRLETSGATFFAASFVPEPGHETPTIEIRAGRGGEVSPWQRTLPSRSGPWSSVQVRLLAARNPIPLGERFESELYDSWIRTAPPEEQHVVWTFLSPTGSTYSMDARYEGDYRWRLEFEPQELGRWRYFWTQQFTRKRYRSADGVFDVVVVGRENARRQLRLLRERIETSGIESSPDRIDRFGVTFARLERAALQLETPETFQSESGQELLALLAAVREALGGRPVPQRINLSSMDRDW
jgi:hypothetical protein